MYKMLPVDIESDDYRFNKTLNQDIMLIPDKYNSKWDMQFKDGDLVNLTGKESLHNAICIAIMTRLGELNGIYKDFGCKIHKLVKANQTDFVQRTIEYRTYEVLNQMRRIKKIDEIIVEKINFGFKINFHITSINDETIIGSVTV